MLTLKRCLCGLYGPFPALLVPLLALALGFPAVAGAADSYVAGEDYDIISPAIRTSHPDKIVVTEFFSYSCGHCYNFEPLISRWKESLGNDVVVEPSPAVWNKPMELLAQAYYTAEVLDVVDLLHLALFQAMHVDRQRLATPAEIGKVFTASGVPGEDFERAFNSFGVGSLVRQADARAKAARISGTPEMMVNGKYRISTRKAGSQAGMLKVAEFLIEQERAALAVASAGGD